MKHKGQPIKNKEGVSFLQRLLDQEAFQDFKFIIQERSSYSRRKRSLKKHLRREISRLKKMRDEDRNLFGRYAVFRVSRFFREFENYFVVMRNVKEWELPKKYQAKIDRLDVELSRKLQIYRIASSWKKIKGSFVYYRATFYTRMENSVQPGGKWYQLEEGSFLHLMEMRRFFLDERCKSIDDEDLFLEVLRKENAVVALLFDAEQC